MHQGRVDVAMRVDTEALRRVRELGHDPGLELRRCRRSSCGEKPNATDKTEQRSQAFIHAQRRLDHVAHLLLSRISVLTPRRTDNVPETNPFAQSSVEQPRELR